MERVPRKGKGEGKGKGKGNREGWIAPSEILNMPMNTHGYSLAYRLFYTMGILWPRTVYTPGINQVVLV